MSDDHRGDFWSRHADPHTSHEAGGDSETRRVIKLNLLGCYATAAERGSGLTDEEAMRMYGYDLADDGHRRRCSDLRREGLIEQEIFRGDGVTRLSERTKKYRIVCVITHAGIDRLIVEGLL
jgi:hypothetical protein